eukprot:CAMPEP_0172921540 /NCGR_PEP_ID=MMETSP1075-20121228/206107_1 /TAXON_ID=2916 /ORGANISM="Ceratium fusus, Strain PA161109" /LENGTH=43 /DNA_ID= /DNA_START= /DNA_END= /DNA_ORIENTATION=
MHSWNGTGSIQIKSSGIIKYKPSPKSSPGIYGMPYAQRGNVHP